jgi:hypothetical protein
MFCGRIVLLIAAICQVEVVFINYTGPHFDTWFGRLKIHRKTLLCHDTVTRARWALHRGNICSLSCILFSERNSRCVNIRLAAKRPKVFLTVFVIYSDNVLIRRSSSRRAGKKRVRRLLLCIHLFQFHSCIYCPRDGSQAPIPTPVLIIGRCFHVWRSFHVV